MLPSLILFVLIVEVVSKPEPAGEGFMEPSAAMAKSYEYHTTFFNTLVNKKSSSAARTFYRKDYHYFHEFEAFYKFHWNVPVNSWLEAFTTCTSEGATLFYPSVPGEFNVVTNLTAAAPRYNTSDIFVGIHDEFHIGEFITVDGSSTPFPILLSDLEPNSGRSCVLLDIVTGNYKIEDCGSKVVLTNMGPEEETDAPPVDNNKGFICKKTVKRSLCPTVDEGYTYSEVTNKCYKVSQQLKPWNEAYRQCYMEGAMLFVPENSNEYDEVINHYISHGENSNNYNYRRSRYGIGNGVLNSYFIGIYQPQARGEYFTIKGVPLVSGGIYQRWYPSDNQEIQETGQNEAANCVTLERKGDSYNGEQFYYYTIGNCYLPRQFICEMKSTFYT